MHNLTIAELAAGLRAKQFSSVELTQLYLKRIEQLDVRLNSFITVTTEAALASARAADALYARGAAGAVTGIPMAQKDSFCTLGIKTSCASRMLDNFTAPYDATLVTRFKQAGMVMLGKTNMDEFAMGSSNENSFYGPVKNPWDIARVPGGSSGGSAAAVAARLAPMTTGTDTGGSIRQPAALCGLTGIKPTYGRVSRYGMIAFASSLDQGGPLTRTAEDAALMLNVMCGFDPNDSTSVDTATPDYTATLNTPLQGVKIGLPKEFFVKELDSRIATALEQAIKTYEQLGATIHSISLPNVHLSIPTYYIVASAECSSNLARYDGVRYGYRCADPKDLNDLYERSRSEGFGAEVKRRIMIGTYVLSADFYNAYYVKAQQTRSLIKQDFQRAFEQVDVILGPTTQGPAFKLGEKIADPVSMYLNDIYTVAANLGGVPAMSLPAGFIDAMPIGLQLIGNYFAEAKLLNMAHQYQQVTNWHQQIPPTFN